VRNLTIALLAVAGLVALGAAVTAEGDRVSGPLTIAKQGFFYAGGHEIKNQGGPTLVDAVFVEYQVPAKITAPYPLVMIHGQFQNGSNFMGTPDDREGWAEYFVRRGYPVYVVDQPARGRSSFNRQADGELTMGTVETIERQFTAIEKYKLWPQARLHTQWPGSGTHGDSGIRTVSRVAKPLDDRQHKDGCGQPCGRSGTSAPDRAGNPADPFALRTVRLGDRQRCAAIGQGHRGGRTERASVLRRRASADRDLSAALGCKRRPFDLRSARERRRRFIP
jgi:hypothetical protein